MLLPSLPTSRTTTFLAEPHEREVVNPGWFWPAMDSRCTCEASRPRWKSSPGKEEPEGPWTSGSLEGSKGGQPIVSKRQHTLQNLSGPEKDAHVKKDTLHYTERKKNSVEIDQQISSCYHETELISALWHSPCCCSTMTRGDRDLHLRTNGSRITSSLYVVWTHTPTGTGGSCFH